MKRNIFSLAVTTALTLSINAHAQQHNDANKMQYPTTEKVNQTDNYFGTIVKDDYRWLENDTAKNTKAWVKEQNKFTNNYLSQASDRIWFKDRLTELWNYDKMGIPSKHDKYITYYKSTGLQNQAVLFIKNTITGDESVLVDPNKLSADGTVALQATAFSENNKYFAYAVSAAGSDWQDIYVMDVATKKILAKDKIEHVKFTNIVWNGEKGFFYSGYSKPKDLATKYSAKTEYQKIFFHTLGTTQDKDAIIYEDKINPLRYVSAQLTENKEYLILNIAKGTDGSEIKFRKLKDEKAPFKTLIAGFNTNADVVDMYKGKFIVVNNDKASNYQIVLADPNKLDQPFEVLIPQNPEAKLSGVSLFGDKLLCTYLQKASSKLLVYNIKDKAAEVIHEYQDPNFATLSGFSGKSTDSVTYFSINSYTQPSTIYELNTNSLEKVEIFKPELKFNPDEYETKQVFYPSKDGTEVSMYIIARKGIDLNGENPTMLYGYGGFNISLTPGFNITLIPFLEKGGIYCVVNLRGGSEYGEEWHKAGMLDKKQNVFDDFIGAAEYLIEHKYTDSKHLAIRGGSNGGLLVGACMTQRPDLFAVAIPQVGVLDMLRYHKFTVGWGWAVEYGTSNTETDFSYLIKYSPLHNIKAGTCYPATMITTADHDDRVVPAHSFKFAAALQEAQGCEKPILIRIDENAGHGAGKPTSKVIDEAADIWSFTLQQMGL